MYYGYLRKTYLIKVTLPIYIHDNEGKIMEVYGLETLH